MKALVIAMMFLSTGAPATEPVKFPLKACVKWSKDIPEAQAAGVGLFDSVARVEGKAPFTGCDIVVETESFGVGWFMRAYMKEAVLSPCGACLGRYSFHYKGDLWQAKLVTGLHEFLANHPEAVAAAKDCKP